MLIDSILLVSTPARRGQMGAPVLPIIPDTPALPRLVFSRFAGARESFCLIKDTEMSLVEGDSSDSLTGSIGTAWNRPVAESCESMRKALIEADARISKLEAERERILADARDARIERDEAVISRIEAQASHHRLQSEKAKADWEEVIGTGEAGLEEEEGVKAIIRSYRSILDSVKLSYA